MVINTGRFELVLSQKLATVGAATSSLDLLMYSRALERIRSGTVFVVSTFSSLPNAAANVGKLYFVSDTEELFWSNGVYGWVSMFPGSINSVWTWGAGGGGRLGDGGVTGRSAPGTTAGGGCKWGAISGAGTHTAAVKANGTAWTWGCNTYGRLGDGTTTNRCSPGTLAGGGNTWRTISAGLSHTGAVKTDGTLWTWGRNQYGQLGDGTLTARNSPGTVSGGGTNWCQFSAGDYHAAAVKTDGTLWTWGVNTLGRLGDGTVVNRCVPGTTAGGGSTWRTISAGPLSNAAVKTDGTLWTWGYNGQGGLGDGTIVGSSSPVTTCGGGTTWCQVDAGSRHTAALKTDGTAWTWGCNSLGALGDGAVANKSSPGTTVSGGTTWCSISASNHTAAIKTDGTAWTWGRNYCGVLGDGTVICRCSPGTVVGGITSWCAVSASGGHTAAIQSITF